MIGRYRIVRELGRGALGSVYHARDEVTDRDVALKVLSPEATKSPSSRAQLLREGRILARLQHPSFPIFYEQGESEGRLYVACELIEGMTLARAFETGISIRAGITSIQQVLSGLAWLHELGIVHRDLKPLNIMLSRSRVAKLLDLTVAYIAGDPPTQCIYGTPRYMSPEQVRVGPPDGRSDLFAVGTILYELVTGSHPFSAPSLTGLLFKILTEDPDLGRIPQARQWDPLRAVIQRALRKRREDRYPDARSMSADLAQALTVLGPDADQLAPKPSVDVTPRVQSRSDRQKLSNSAAPRIDFARSLAAVRPPTGVLGPRINLLRSMPLPPRDSSINLLRVGLALMLIWVVVRLLDAILPR